MQDLLESLSTRAVNELDRLKMPNEAAETEVTMTDKKLFTVLRTILITVGQMRFLSTDLLDSICSKMTDSADVLGSRELVAFLVTTATLNYQPKNSEKLYDVRLDASL